MARISAATLIWVASVAMAAPGACVDNAPILQVSATAWNTLNASVSGHLFAGRPYDLPCFSSYQNGTALAKNAADETVCKSIGSKVTDSEDLVAHFGSYHNPTFSSCMARDQRCQISASNFAGVTNGTCYQGTVPDYYIDAQSVDDVKKGIEFAKAHKIPVSVKSSGHDYKGRSTGVHTLAIWVHNLPSQPEVKKTFTPEACTEDAGPAVTYGPGLAGIDLYRDLNGSGYFAVGGSCTTVAMGGGWLAGGGHGIMSPNFGLGVDNALEIKAVLPNGNYITANRCQNQDLFFALRGGGGGTFGVVTEVTSKLYADRKFTYAVLIMDVQTDSRDITQILVDNAIAWADEGWSGLYSVEGTTASFLGFNPNLDEDGAAASLKPIIDYFDSKTTASNAYLKKFTTFANHWDAQNAPEKIAFLASEAGVSLTRASRLVPRKNFETEASRKELVDVLVAYPWSAVLSAPTNYTLADSDKAGGVGEASITPAWREAVWHFTYTSTWDQADATATSPKALTKIFNDISKAMDPMRAITPGAGAYQSEGDLYEPDHIASFWGQDNYNRLLKIKNQVDPDNLFSCYTCVGYQKTDTRNRCYLDVGGEDQQNQQNLHETSLPEDSVKDEVPVSEDPKIEVVSERDEL